MLVSRSTLLVPLGALLVSLPSVTAALRHATVALVDGFSGSNNAGIANGVTHEACATQALKSVATVYQYNSATKACQYGAPLPYASVFGKPASPGVYTGYIGIDCATIANNALANGAVVRSYFMDTARLAQVRATVTTSPLPGASLSLDRAACEQRCFEDLACAASVYGNGGLCKLFSTSINSLTSGFDAISIIGGCDVARAALVGVPATCTDAFRVTSCPTGSIKNSDESGCLKATDCGGILAGSLEKKPHFCQLWQMLVQRPPRPRFRRLDMRIYSSVPWWEGSVANSAGTACIKDNDCGGILAGSLEKNPTSVNYGKCSCNALYAPVSDGSTCVSIVPCLGGTVRDVLPGSTTVGQCICPTGTIFNSLKTSCLSTSCPPGRTRDIVVTSPKYDTCACGTGFISASDGIACIKPITCPPGQTQDLTDVTEPGSCKCGLPNQVYNSDKSACVSTLPCPVNGFQDLVKTSPTYNTCQCKSGFVFNTAHNACLEQLTCPPGLSQNLDIIVGPIPLGTPGCKCTDPLQVLNSDKSACVDRLQCPLNAVQNLVTGSSGYGTCQCNTGFIFNTEKTICLPKLSCLLPNQIQNLDVKNLLSSCICKSGFLFNSAGTACLEEITCPLGLSQDLDVLLGPSKCKCSSPLQILNSDKSACLNILNCPLNAIQDLVSTSPTYGSCQCTSDFIFNKAGDICLPKLSCLLPNQIQDLDVTTAGSSCICKAGSIPSTIPVLGCIVDALCDANTAQQDLAVAVPTCLCKLVGSVLATGGKSCLKLGASQVVGGARKKKRNLSDEAALCPPGLEACSIGSHDGYECVDLSEELERCGHCNNNCLDIEGVDGVSCSAGSCQIFSCAPGYKLAFDSNVCRPRIAKRH